MGTKSDILTAHPTAAVGAEGTIAFDFPAGRNEDYYSFAGAGVRLYIAALGTLLEAGEESFTVAEDGGDAVVTYHRDTVIPAGSRVTLELPIASQEKPPVEFIEESDAADERVNVIQRALLAAGIMAPPLDD